MSPCLRHLTLAGYRTGANLLCVPLTLDQDQLIPKWGQQSLFLEESTPLVPGTAVPPAGFIAGDPQIATNKASQSHCRKPLLDEARFCVIVHCAVVMLSSYPFFMHLSTSCPSALDSLEFLGQGLVYKGLRPGHTSRVCFPQYGSHHMPYSARMITWLRTATQRLAGGLMADLQYLPTSVRKEFKQPRPSET